MKGWGKTGDTSDSSLCDVLFEADAHRPFQRHLENQRPVVLRCHGNRVLHYSTLCPNNLWWGNKKKTKADLILDWETTGQVLVFLSRTTGRLSSPGFIWPPHKVQHEMLFKMVFLLVSRIPAAPHCAPQQFYSWDRLWLVLNGCETLFEYRTFFPEQTFCCCRQKHGLISVGLQGFEI